MRLVTVNDFHAWASTLKGEPRIAVEESGVGEVTVYYHRQHRRRINYGAIADSVPVNIRVWLKTVGHAELRKRHEANK